MKGGDYDIDKPPPMVPVALDPELQKEAADLPPFLPGMTIVSYSQENPQLSFNQVITAYHAFLQKNSFQDPGNPSESLRTPEEVQHDKQLQKKVADTFINGIKQEEGYRVANDALNVIHAGEQYVAPVVTALAPELGEANDAAQIATTGIAHFLGIPEDLSDQAASARIVAQIQQLYNTGT
jgi:hypothetical protein